MHMDYKLKYWTPTELDELTLPPSGARALEAAKACPEHVQLAQAAAVLYEHGGLVVDLDTWPARSFEDFYYQMLTDRGRFGHPAPLFVSFNGTEVAQQPV